MNYIFIGMLLLMWKFINVYFKLEAQWAEPVSLTFQSALRKLYTEPSMVLPTKFRFIWPLSFRGEDYLEIDQSETIITYGGHVC
jgi:hypothetical protein